MSNFGYPINMNKNEIRNAVFQRLAAAPSSPVAGQYYLNTTDGVLYKRNEANSTWEPLSSTSWKNDNHYVSVGDENSKFVNNNSSEFVLLLIEDDGVFASGSMTVSLQMSLSSVDCRIFAYVKSNSLATYNLNYLNAGNPIISGLTANKWVEMQFVAAENKVFVLGSSAYPNALDRANHTGTQLASTISNFTSAAQTAAPAETAGTIGTLTNSATVKATLVDADMIPVMDSAASNIIKKWSFANLKAQVLTIPLVGWALGSNSSVTTSDTITGAIGKLQAQINATVASVLAGLLTGYTAGTNTVLTATTSFLDAFRNLQAQITAYAASAITFTNKSIDAATNTLSNLTTSMFAANVIDNDATMAANSATRIPTQQAVFGLIDAKIKGQMWKTAVRILDSSNAALATAYANGQVLQGATLATNDRLYLDGRTGGENGLYFVNATGAPTRATDANTAILLRQATFEVMEGTNADTQWTVSNDTITLGTTNLTIVQNGGGSVPSASTLTAGKVYLATSAEAKAKANVANKAVDPTALVDFVYANAPVQFGNGTLTQFDFTHSFATITGYQIKKVSTNEVWNFLVTEQSGTNLRVNTGIIPTTNEFSIVISGK
jgi:hypothetical protein